VSLPRSHMREKERKTVREREKGREGGRERVVERERAREGGGERGVQVVVVPKTIAEERASERERDQERERERGREPPRTVGGPLPLAWGLGVWVSGFEFRDSGVGIRVSSLQSAARRDTRRERGITQRKKPAVTAGSNRGTG